MLMRELERLYSPGPKNISLLQVYNHSTHDSTNTLWLWLVRTTTFMRNDTIFFFCKRENKDICFGLKKKCFWITCLKENFLEEAKAIETAGLKCAPET